MVKKTLSTELRNIARGGLAYRSARYRIAKLLCDHPQEVIPPLPSFLAKSLFALKPHQKSHALPFSEEEWRWLARLEATNSAALEENYLTLLTHFITENADAIRSATDVARRISESVLRSDPIEVEKHLLAADHHTRQSLLIFKAAAALYSQNQSSITEYFVKNPHSDWVRHVFLYPLIFVTLSRPDDEYLPKLVAHVFPSYETSAVERNAMAFLIRDRADWHTSLTLRAYLALSAHPYDALQILIGYCRQEVARAKVLSHQLRRSLELIEAVIGCPEARLLLDIINEKPMSYANTPSELLPYCDIAAPFREFHDAFFDSKSECPPLPEGELLQALHRMRWSRYPTKADFNLVLGWYDLYQFTSAGDLLRVMLTSLYMVPRKDPLREAEDLIEQVGLLGGLTPFTLSSPRGAFALSSGLFTASSELGWVHIETLAANYLAGSDLQTRVWIKEFHYRVRGAERLMRISAWLKAVHTEIPLHANTRYLSGIHWGWLAEVIDAKHIRPFADTPEGIYVLLIRTIEEGVRDSNDIRMALRPVAERAGSVHGLVYWAVEHFGVRALAFVRFVLTPEMILMLKLEHYYPAALTERLKSLEYVVGKFGLQSDYLTREQYEDEQRSLTNSLYLMNVGAAQFELAWSSLRADAIAGARDAYQALMAVDETHHAVHALAKFEKEAPLTYGNTGAKSYRLKNSDWPKAVLIGQVIETFLDHPSYGIESILAVRIRHDNFRYELSIAVDRVMESPVSAVNDHDKARITPLFQETIDDVVQGWIDETMHTSSPDGTDPIFSFLPNQHDMDRLISQISDGLDDIVDTVLTWLKERLESSLIEVRQSLSDDLKVRLEVAIRDRAAELGLLAPEGEDCVLEVGTALVSALKHRCDELQDWFRSPEDRGPQPLSYAELKMAVEGRYRAEIEAGRLRLTMGDPDLSLRQIRAEHVRLMFDIWCEVAKNAMKYSGRETARVRVSRAVGPQLRGVVFTSLSTDGVVSDASELGRPYRSASDALFQSGRSGIVKIAHLAASIAGAEVAVQVRSRRGAFQLVVPFEVRV